MLTRRVDDVPGVTRGMMSQHSPRSRHPCSRTPIRGMIRAAIPMWIIARIIIRAAWTRSLSSWSSWLSRDVWYRRPRIILKAPPPNYRGSFATQVHDIAYRVALLVVPHIANSGILLSKIDLDRRISIDLNE